MGALHTTVTYTVPFKNAESFRKELDFFEAGRAVELALYHMHETSREIRQLPRNRVGGMHGPILPLQERFKRQQYTAAGYARHLGLTHIILHPHKVKGDENERIREQERTKTFLEKYTLETGITPVLETFAGRNRVFRPEEIVEQGMLMDLDVAHLDTIRTLEIIIAHSKKIHSVHLSGVEEGDEGDKGKQRKQHVPITTREELIIEQMLVCAWSGTIGIEYEDVYRNEARTDAIYFSNIIQGIEFQKKEMNNHASMFFRKALQQRRGYLALYLEGATKIKTGEYAEARRCFEEALTYYEGHAMTHLLLSYALRGLKHDTRAKHHEQRCMQINPELEKEIIHTQ